MDGGILAWFAFEHDRPCPQKWPAADLLPFIDLFGDKIIMMVALPPEEYALHVRELARRYPINNLGDT